MCGGNTPRAYACATILSNPKSCSSATVWEGPQKTSLLTQPLTASGAPRTRHSARRCVVGTLRGLCLCHDPAAGLSLSPAAPGESFSLSLSIPRFSLQRPQLGALSAWTRCDCNPLCHVPIAKQPPVSQEFSSLQGGRPSCFLSSTRFLPSGCLARRPHMVAPNPIGLFTQAGPLHP